MLYQLMGSKTISMRLLLITNLYPPQELGGYGRCMADFAWGLQQRGHTLQVISSDASYLGPSSSGPSSEPVDRRLQLKGSFQGGVISCRTQQYEKRWMQTIVPC